ncbi:MAG: acetyl-CoA decarbonylase/synthase complex subunit gamma [bacterium]
MALTGVQIFKKLPQTNCKECNFPTCLAFAMALASAKTEIEKCPYVSKEVKSELAEASAPPIRGVKIGSGETAITIGEETVLFRHEKRFEHPTAFGVLITDEEKETEITRKIKALNETKYLRVGVELKPELAALKNTSKNKETFMKLVNTARDSVSGCLMLMSEDVEILGEAARLCKDKRPILYAATSDNYQKVAQISKENNCPIVARGNGLEELATLTDNLVKTGIKDIVLDSNPSTLKQAYEDQIFTRRLSLLKAFRPLGFPTIAFPCEMTDNLMEESLIGTVFISKYAGIVIFSDIQPHHMLPLLVYRLNLFTDPQRPLTMDEGIYEFGNPDASSPVLITCNFSLTYFVVSGEIEASNVPLWLCVMNTDGLSVLTAWSAGKFVPDLIAPFVKKCGIVDRVKHRNLIIPGYVAQISGELEEELNKEWNVKVGCREASDLPLFLQQFAKI